MAEPGALNYRSAGVDLDAAEGVMEGLKLLVASTMDEHTLSAPGPVRWPVRRTRRPSEPGTRLEHG